MDEKILFESMNAIDDDILLRSEEAIDKQAAKDSLHIDTADKSFSTSYTRKKHPCKKHPRRLSAILIAATLAALLMGAGLAAILYGDNIQSWFSYYWEQITGQEMSDKQTALIDHLSQDIGLSQTVDDITVTVDSATVGMDSFYLLIRVEGAKLSSRHAYGFRNFDMLVSPDPLETLGGMGSYGFEFHGLDGDGAAILLIDYDYVTKKGYVEDTRPLDIILTLDDFSKDPHNDYRKVLGEGHWDFSFTLERNRLPQQITLPDQTVMVIDLREREQYTEVPVPFTDIVLTNTGIQFSYDFQNGSLDFDGRVRIHLRNGQSIGISGGTGVPLEDSGMLFCNYKWRIPVDLDEVTAVSLGETIVNVNP